MYPPRNCKTTTGYQNLFIVTSPPAPQMRSVPTAPPSSFIRLGAPGTEAKRSAEHAGTQAGAAGGAMGAPVITAAPLEQKRSVGIAKRLFSKR
jgi:hypothetical protein